LRGVRRLNLDSLFREPAITRLDRFITATQRSSHSFATETGVPFRHLLKAVLK